MKDNRWLRRHNHCDGSSSNSNSNSSDHPLGAKSTSTVSFSVNTGGSLKGDRNDPARDALHSHLLTPKVSHYMPLHDTCQHMSACDTLRHMCDRDRDN